MELNHLNLPLDTSGCATRSAICILKVMKHTDIIENNYVVFRKFEIISSRYSPFYSICELIDFFFVFSHYTILPSNFHIANLQGGTCNLAIVTHCTILYMVPLIRDA